MPKKPTPKQIIKELQTSAREYDELCRVIHKRMLWNAANRLNMAPEELEEEFAALT